MVRKSFCLFFCAVMLMPSKKNATRPSACAHKGGGGAVSHNVVHAAGRWVKLTRMAS